MSYIEKYQAKDGWRWRFVHTNGNIMAESGEAYVREEGANNALRTLRAEFGNVTVYRPGATLMGSTKVPDTAFGYANALRMT